MASTISIERALAAIEEVEKLQSQMEGVLAVLKNLSERLVKLEASGGSGGKS